MPRAPRATSKSPTESNWQNWQESFGWPCCAAGRRQCTVSSSRLGPQAHALMSVLHKRPGLSHGKVAWMMQSVFGLKIDRSTSANNHGQLSREVEAIASGLDYDSAAELWQGAPRRPYCTRSRGEIFGQRLGGVGRPAPSAGITRPCTRPGDRLYWRRNLHLQRARRLDHAPGLLDRDCACLLDLPDVRPGFSRGTRERMPVARSRADRPAHRERKGLPRLAPVGVGPGRRGV